MGTFIAQLGALCWKNSIILWRHKWINLLRCLILPVAYAAFFAKAQDFFTTRGIFGPGHIAPLQPFPDDLLGHKLVWAPPPAAATNTTIAQYTTELMQRVLEGVTGNVEQVNGNDAVITACPENFNLLSECFAAIVFNDIDPGTGELNYTLRGDYGLARVDVENLADDDLQQRFLPLQWRIESNFINLTTGEFPTAPYSWEYTNQTKEERNEMLRMSYLRGIRSLIVLAFFLGFLGVVYQLPGNMASERASTLTAHLDAMGCRTSARIISWHLSISGVYVVAWICAAIIYQQTIWVHTNAGLMIVIYLVTGLSLASWTYLVAAPFANAPTLAAITCTFLAIILAIVGQLVGSGVAIEAILTIIFPPTFYIFVTKSMASFELASQSPSVLRQSPAGDAPILGLLILAIIDIFLFPLLAVWLERRLYGVRLANGQSRRWLRQRKNLHSIDPVLASDVAVQISNLSKSYTTRRWGGLRKGEPVVAIKDLSFSVPRGKIFCLLGRNGAAKSTTLSAIARLMNVSGGTIRYADDQRIGVASQKDVLWDELTCMQHVALWRAIKGGRKHAHENDEQLVDRCDLGLKANQLSNSLSGGQKRKLQLACALAGGSNLLLLDEISSGLDPLSRRAIWKLITANRGKATIILTTHFLDEADYLGDNVAILQQPGKLLALDNPVALKTQLGRGCTLAVDDIGGIDNHALLDKLRDDVSTVTVRTVKGKHLYLTASNDLRVARLLAKQLQKERSAGIDVRYQIGSATLEEVFLDLNVEDEVHNTEASVSTVQLEGSSADSTSAHKDVETPALGAEVPPQLTLTPGRHGSWLIGSLRAAWTIFVKRILVLRRAWLLPLVAAIVVICASAVPLFFMSSRVQTCAPVVTEEKPQALTYPISYFPYLYSPVVISVDQGAQNLANWSRAIGHVEIVDGNASFVELFDNFYDNITFGGLSLAAPTNASIVAFEGSPVTLKGISALNLFSNSFLQQVLPKAEDASMRIIVGYEWIPSPSFESTGSAFKWLGFFGLGVAIWPAFATVYPTIERATYVRANQYSNGANPVALWLGHLLFELPGIFLVSTIIIITFATVSSQFNALGDLWICFVLYGISSTLYAYLFALFLNSPLASWAIVAGTNVILFLLYLATYLLILTYDRSTAAAEHMTICHFTLALINPVPNIMRAILVSLNLFSLLCDGLGNRTTAPYSSILQFGGPILYMVLQIVFAFGVLVYVDSGSPIPSFLRSKKVKSSHSTDHGPGIDVIEEKERVDRSSSEALLVRDLSKKFRSNPIPAVHEVSFGVHEGDTFALIGPNGAGKTTTLACIRGVEVPTKGDVVVTGHSIVHARNRARASLGVCPQINAMDPNLTVRQHLWLYGRLKGVPSNSLKQDITSLLTASGLLPKADTMAISLSGGNQRKLSLAIALIGDRPVILIDEFSSGVDPFSKREAWATLATLTQDRAVVMTTHSMEEVDALASRVGIIASKMLAVGTPTSLKSRFATYEVHLSAEHAQSTLCYIQSHGFDTAHRSLDTLTRLSVPGVREDDLDRLLSVLECAQEELGLAEMTLHEASTETAFLSIVREHNIQEEQGKIPVQKRRWWLWWKRIRH